MIKQSTGEDWNNANISLSTAQPDIGGSAPQLGVHHIGFVRPRAVAIGSFMINDDDGLYCSDNSMYDAESCEFDEIEEEGEFYEKDMAFLRGGKKGGRSKLWNSHSPSLEVTVAKVHTVLLNTTTMF